MKITYKLLLSLTKDIVDPYCLFSKDGNVYVVEKCQGLDDIEDMDIPIFWKVGSQISFKDQKAYNAFTHDACKRMHIFICEKDKKECLWIKKED